MLSHSSRLWSPCWLIVVAVLVIRVESTPFITIIIVLFSFCPLSGLVPIDISLERGRWSGRTLLLGTVADQMVSLVSTIVNCISDLQRRLRPLVSKVIGRTRHCCSRRGRSLFRCGCDSSVATLAKHRKVCVDYLPGLIAGVAFL